MAFAQEVLGRGWMDETDKSQWIIDLVLPFGMTLFILHAHFGTFTQPVQLSARWTKHSRVWGCSLRSPVLGNASRHSSCVARQYQLWRVVYTFIHFIHIRSYTHICPYLRFFQMTMNTVYEHNISALDILNTKLFLMDFSRGGATSRRRAPCCRGTAGEPGKPQQPNTKIWPLCFETGEEKAWRGDGENARRAGKEVGSRAGKD